MARYRPIESIPCCWIRLIDGRAWTYYRGLIRTLLDAIFLGFALALLLLHTLDTLVEVVLGRGTLGRIFAFYRRKYCQHRPR